MDDFLSCLPLLPPFHSTLLLASSVGGGAAVAQMRWRGCTPVLRTAHCSRVCVSSVGTHPPRRGKGREMVPMRACVRCALHKAVSVIKRSKCVRKERSPYKSTEDGECLTNLSCATPQSIYDVLQRQGCPIGGFRVHRVCKI